MSSRRVVAGFLGLVAGASGFMSLTLAGWLLYHRLWGDSAPAFAVILLVFGAAGLYAGWLLALIVFSAVRGSGEGGDQAA